MSTTPQTRIYGPYDKDGNLITQGSVSLWNTEDSRADVSADLDAKNVFGQNSDEAILGGYLGKEEFTFSGIATGNRLSNNNSYVDDPIGALKQFVIELESLVSDGQGIGYKLEDDQRDEVITPVNSDDGILVESISWTRTDGEPYQVEWELDCSRGRATGSSENKNRQEYIDDESSQWIEDGAVSKYIPFDREFNPNYDHKQKRGEILQTPDFVPASLQEEFDLGTITEKRVDREVPVDITQLALSDPGENLGVPTGSPEDNIFVDGRISPKHLSHRYDIDKISKARDRMDTFARFVSNNWVGTNTSVVYVDAFTDRQFSGQIDSFSTTWTAGEPSILEYSLEIKAGETY